MPKPITRIELRCPIGPKALLGKMVLANEPVHRTDGNLLELHCRDCTKRIKQNDATIVRICHRFDVLGELVMSTITHEDGTEDMV